jgi:hypothetical protein
MAARGNWQCPRKKLMITTQAINEFFLSEDTTNFAITNDDSSLVAKPLWVSVERHDNFHLALALGVGQTAIGPLMQFYHDTSMACEFGSMIDEKNAEGFSFQAFFKPEDGAARIILFEAPMNRDNGESNFALDLPVLRGSCGHLGLRCFSRSGGLDLELLLSGSRVPMTALACLPHAVITRAVLRATLRPSA